MKREWQPGDLAMVTWPVNCDSPIPSVRGHGAWHMLDHVTRTKLPDGFMSDPWLERLDATFRPLAVIDFEDDEQVERLAVAFLRQPLDDLAVRMRAALREFANPTPRIEEPTGWLAAVIDDVGDKWVRDGMAGDRSQSGHWWNYTVAAEKGYDGVLRADWQAINVVRVLSEGVKAGESE